MLNILKSPKPKQKSKRVGRGIGTGKGGHTVGRGQKGQKSRAGYTVPRPGFEGGQMPLSRRLPKLKGFKRGYFKSRQTNIILNLSDLDKTGLTIVSAKTLTDAGILSSKRKDQAIKILSDGDITKKIEVTGIKVSSKAKAKIEKAGGKVE